MLNKITPIILAGGSGTRLWPLSRKSYPKQFTKFLGELSLFQESVLRLTSSERLKFHLPVILTNPEFRFIVGEQLQAVGCDKRTILIEPESKNTAPSILAACLSISRTDPEAIVVVSPSDHIIPEKDVFHDAILKGMDIVKQGKIATFGVLPDRPETGYGYLELSKETTGMPVPLSGFVEKPDLGSAQKMLAAGNFLWNAGIFMFRVKDMISAFEQYCPELTSPVTKSIEQGQNDLDFFRLSPDAWSQCVNISIDFAIMEKAFNLVAIPLNTAWSDLGGWDSVWKEQPADENGVVTTGAATSISCEDTLLYSGSDSLELVGLGLKNIVAVALSDAVLVANKDKAQDVKHVVAALKEKGVIQAEQSTKDHRPWGWFESLVKSEQFQVKRIHVNSKSALSLQSHQYRSEHWVVVQGIATVTVNDDVFDLKEGESVYIPQEAVHRLENKTLSAMVLIEVQTGIYLGEDDIIRYEDRYAR